ncbi:alpha/beta fold hydrolase [Tannockella kyphosi]|uniref:alpha/beta fold hydrolase n=1 Tax=Tannockella kyphosi TaxID=2899121 RepID=UPI0020133F70|nr:alpha/beta hydrolase [Tannockella kyphosi]
MNKIIDTFISSNLTSTIQYYIYEPDSNPKGIIQLTHGMMERIELYEEFIGFMCDKGFIVCGHDHIGHGHSGELSDSFGFFANTAGYRYLIEDLHQLNTIIKEKYDDLPYFLIGHSLGSLVARNYLRLYANEVDGCVFSASGSASPLTVLGLIYVEFKIKRSGPHFVSESFEKTIFGNFNKGQKDKFSGWLCSNQEFIETFKNDSLCQFGFSLSAYRDLLTLFYQSNKQNWFTSVPNEMPILLLSGNQDPIMNNGKDMLKVEENLRKTNHTKINSYLYDGSMHNLFHEIDRSTVFNDIYQWITAL